MSTLISLALVVGLSPAAAAANGPAGSPAAPAAPAATVAPPDTPVGRAVAWLLDVSRRLPASDADLAAHLSPSTFTQLTPAEINETLVVLAGPSGLTLLSYQGVSDQQARALFANGEVVWIGGLTVDAAGLIESMSYSVYLDPPGSWRELDRRMRAIAPHVSLLVARVDDRSGDCRPVHAIAATTARPLASSFKLYVLGALADAVRTGRASWDEPLAIREDTKSLPSGVFQTLPAGTQLPLRTYADYMIAISDNTATDHLIGRLGRDAVERQQVRFGIGDPRHNLPFLTTRELFQLRLTNYPTLQDTYRRLPAPARAGYLATRIDPLPLPSVEQELAWTTPRGIDAVEWFASPVDLCRAYAGLSRQATGPTGQPVDEALSLNDGGLWLDPTSWTRTWFKGGSEPGVLTLNFLARTVTGQTYVVSVMASDPTAAIPDAAIPQLLAITRGAFALATGGGRHPGVLPPGSQPDPARTVSTGPRPGALNTASAGDPRPGFGPDLPPAVAPLPR